MGVCRGAQHGSSHLPDQARHVVRPVDGRIPPGGGTSDSMAGDALRIDQLENRRQQIHAGGIDKRKEPSSSLQAMMR